MADPSMVGLCDLWATEEDVNLCGDPLDVDDEVLQRCLAMASRACFVLGGNRWPGVCTDTVDIWTAGCSCAPVAGRRCGLLHLPEGPIIEVVEVIVDGLVLDPSEYRIVDDEALVRVDGVWPSGRLQSDGSTDLQVTYTYGGTPTALGVHAAAVLARELALALCDSDACRLDRRLVRSVTREGIDEELGAAMPGLIDALRDGRIGLPEVDLFVFSENPGNLRRPGRFVVPGSDDLSHRRIR